MKTGFISIGEPKEKNRMIMVIGGRCQGKSSFAKEHFENIAKLGINFVQGYYFSKPVTARQFLLFINENNK